MSDAEDKNEQNLITDFIQDPIPTYPNPHRTVTRQFLAVRWSRVLGQAFYPLQDSGGLSLGNVPEILSYAGSKFNSI